MGQLTNARRVVVTGLGLVTPLGCLVQEVWEKLTEKKCGIKQLTGQEYEKLPCRVAGILSEQDLEDVSRCLSGSDKKQSSKAVLYGLAAAQTALRCSGILDDSGIIDLNTERIGVCVGMGMSDLNDIYNSGLLCVEKGYNRLTPYFIPRILPNMAAGQISMKFNLQGPNHCASTACATGAHAIGDGYNLIRLGHADMILCGGTEAPVNPLSIAGFCRLRALATRFNEEPEKASRPFDKDRNGFVMGEGAGVVVLEELETAIARKVPILAEVLGYGLSGDASHLTAAREDGQGALNAMTQALEFAKLSPSDVDYVNCHATSTPIGDRAETKALRRLFKDQIQNIPISSCKGNIGHLLGAAGAVESIFTILACHKRSLPPNVDIDIDEEFEDLNILIDTPAQSAKPLIALKNSFGFGGTNASLCFSSYPPKK